MASQPDFSLPPPSPEAAAHSHELAERIATVIGEEGGWIPFSRYMELALYEPGQGYYAAGSRKIGAEGDFVTAPEISPGPFTVCDLLPSPEGAALHLVHGGDRRSGAGP